MKFLEIVQGAALRILVMAPNKTILMQNFTLMFNMGLTPQIGRKRP